MNLLIWLIPWTLSVGANEIWMGRNEPKVVAELIELQGSPFMAMPVREFVRVKRKAESAHGYCESAVDAAAQTAHEECLTQIEEAVNLEKASRVEDRRVIEALELALEREQLLRVEHEAFGNTMTWVSVGVGAVAVGTTLALIVR
jgi:hypothetical protein